MNAQRQQPFYHPEQDFLFEPATGEDQAPPAEAGFPVEGRIFESQAAAAFLGRRVELVRNHGPAAAAALERDPRELARELCGRADAVRERLAGRDPPGEAQRETALLTLLSVGAIALALYDRLADFTLKESAR